MRATIDKDPLRVSEATAYRLFDQSIERLYQRCRCGFTHRCPACGKRRWVEDHGYADGECMACGYRA